MRPQTARDRRRIDLAHGHAVAGAVLRIDRNAGPRTACAAKYPKRQKVEAQDQAGERECPKHRLWALKDELHIEPSRITLRAARRLLSSCTEVGDQIVE